MDEVMRAAVLVRHGGLDALEVRHDWPVPTVGAGEVLVRVTAAAVNNTDIWTRDGAYGLPGHPDALAGWRGPISFPRVQGGDIAGVVVACAGTPALSMDGRASSIARPTMAIFAPTALDAVRGARLRLGR